VNVIFALMYNPKRPKIIKNIPLISSKAVMMVFISLLSIITIDNQAFSQGYKIKTIVIDAGHGGKDGATRGSF
jgi:N-acetylmuramoyl-L-alanine amidase